RQPLVACLESHSNNPEQCGIIQNFEGEAWAVIDMLTSRVERAQFGIPQERKTVQVEGRWKNAASPLNA
ncbi:MAG: hypothetical protein ACQKBT_11265, partial [Puniceicoccales bacterium]